MSRALSRCARRYLCESLESRRLLSTINWTNRGGAIIDSDGFNATFGANANLARSIVDRVIGEWQTVISSFNRVGGGNSYSLIVNTQNLTNESVHYSETPDANGIPLSGDIQLDTDANGSGWYLDPVPGTAALPDDSDYGGYVSPTSAVRTVSPTQRDLYYVVSFAMVHCMGLFLGSSRLGSLVVNTGVADPNVPGQNLYRYNAPSGTYTFSTDAGATLYDGLAFGSITSHPNDVASYTFPKDERRLISNADALILHDAYGYTTTTPQNSFYANYNTSTHVLNVRGDGGFSGNSMGISCGATTQVAVNGTVENITDSVSELHIGVSGSMDLTLGGSLPSTTTIDGGVLNDIISLNTASHAILSSLIVNGNGGTDRLTFFHTGATGYEVHADHVIVRPPIGFLLDASYSNFEQMQITTSTGADSITIDGCPPAVTVNGSAGTDSLSWDQSDSLIDQTFTLNTSTLTNNTTATTIEMTSVDRVTLTSGGGDDTFNVTNLDAVRVVTLNGGLGDDIFGVLNGLGSGFGAVLNVNGDGGTDSFTADDSAVAVLTDYSVTTAALQKNSQPTPYTSIETLTLIGGPGFGSVTVDSLASGVNFTYDARAGNDSLQVGQLASGPTGNIQGTVHYIGGANTDSVTISNQTDATAADIVHVMPGSVGIYPGDNIFGVGGKLLYDSDVETLSMTTSTLSDTIYARPSPDATITINAANPSIAPGDKLILALGNVPNFVINPSGSSGNVTSDYKTLSWSNVETRGPDDAIKPSVVTSSLDYQTSPHAIVVQFNENVSPTLTAGALTVPGRTFNLGSYNAGTNTARFTYTGGVLPDGNYTGLLNNIFDVPGNSMAANTPVDPFFFVLGDANHDRFVNMQDFNLLATNFNKVGMTYGQADLNYDGKVNARDFNILATRYGTHLAAPDAPVPASAAAGKTVADLFAGTPIREPETDLLGGNADPSVA